MGNLTSLVHFDFSYNSLIGNIPSLQKSKNLTHLDLSHNRLSGTIPSAYFKGLGNLVHVDLGFNLFTGSIPSSLFALQSLQKIKLLQNQFSGLLANFSNASMSQLDTLDLSSNNLNGSIPFSWFELKLLNILSLSCNQLFGSLQLDTIHKLGNLTSLDLSYNKLSIETSRNSSSKTLLPQYITFKLASCQLKSFPNLENQLKLSVLDLSDNQIGGALPNWTWSLGNGYLTIQDTGYCDSNKQRVRGSIPPAIGNLKQLEALDFSVNKLSGGIPVELANLNFLSYLNLSNNQLTGSIPTWSQFSTFEEGSFRGNEGLCGKILNRTCPGTSSGSYFPPLKKDHYSSDKPDGILISAVTGFFVGLGIVVLPLLYYKKWRTYYYEHVNQALEKFLPMHSKKKKNRKQRRGNLTHRGRRTRL
ncbi:hypothetical protein POM88_008035 [Heracleum sosnowskyi]|uniref:Uncharacterized protein n=1 Tax=Heracleum sosnowskyi TaxID=360622 RepID=A0AAD8J947_9APIA|nr:hypothetical protein POM88_008035 [Heracleum sosnowskyi]